MGFQCQQFYIKDDQCAMKVSTDSLLLGSYAPVSGMERALDMGTGSGLLALMLAQRAPQAVIDAFDVDDKAVMQARDNVAHSPWPDRVHITSHCVSTWQAKQRYDLIVCNPPYFNAHRASGDAARELARQGKVSPEAWVACALRGLHPHGKLYWVLPVQQAEVWQAQARACGLHLIDELRIQTTAAKPTKLVIQGWQLQAQPKTQKHALTIHASEGGYSEDFRRLTGEFYLAGRHVIRD